MRIQYVGLVLLNLVVGCAGTQTFKTASGKPEVVIQEVSKKQVTEALISRMIGQGWTVKDTTDYQVSFVQQGQSVLIAMAWGGRSGGNIESKATFHLLEANGGVRVICSVQVTAAPGSPDQMTSDATSKYGQNCMSAMNAIKSQLEKTNPVGEQ